MGIVAPGTLRIYPCRLSYIGKGLIAFPRQEVGAGAVCIRNVAFRVELYHYVKVGDRIIELFKDKLKQAPLQICFLEIWLKFNRLVVDLKGIVEFFEIRKGDAPAAAASS